MMKTNSLKKQNEEFQESFQKVRNKYSPLQKVLRTLAENGTLYLNVLFFFLY